MNFFAAEASEDVAAGCAVFASPRTASARARHERSRAVPERVTVRIVRDLEMVHVEHAQAERRTAAAAAPDTGRR